MKRNQKQTEGVEDDDDDKNNNNMRVQEAMQMTICTISS